MLGRIITRLSSRELVAWNVRNPVFPILIALAVTLFFGWQIPKLSFKTSVYDLEIEDISETKRYQEFKALFGSDEIIRVVVKTEDVFQPETFEKIGRLSDELSKIDGIRRVISLPEIKKAIDMSGSWSMDKFYTVISHVDLFQKNLISSDRKTAALTLVLETDARQDVVIHEVGRLILAAENGISLYQVGMPLISQALVHYTEKDFSRLPPITFLLIAVILFLLFRKPQYVLIPLVCVLIVLVWTFGLMALAGIPLSMLTMIVPVFLIAVGTAYCLHIVTEYLACVRVSKTPQEAALATYSTVLFPTVLAVLTTMVGLGSLLINRIPSIREFALFSCFGMFSLLVVNIVMLPAFLALIPLPGGEQSKRVGEIRIFDLFIQKIIHLDIHRQKVVLPILAGLMIFCLIGILRIQVETNPIDYFKEKTPVKRHFHDIYQDLSGSFPIHIVMESGKKDYFEDPQHVAEIARFQAFLATLPGIDKSISFADYMKLVNYALNGFDPKYYALPEEGFEVRMVMNNYTTMLGEDMYVRFMNKELSTTNIVLLTHISSSRDFLKTRERILAFAQENFSKDLAWDVTGFGIAISASSHRITSGQIKSLSLTLIIVFAIMFTLFLSLKVGFIAIAVNLFPIIVNFGIMGWFGIELSMVTSLIASIAIGLAVDDTIHYLFRYNRDFKKDLDEKRAIRDTLMQVGRPIAFTTLTICVGFSILMFSSFKPTAVFGAMMTVTMIAALVGDLILLPSLMQHVELVTLWDLVRLKLGVEPAKGIPLFKGLSRTEVHYIIMAGVLKKIEAGEVLFHKGDPSDSMYTIVSGSMDVIDPVSDADACLESGGVGNSRFINRMKVGEVLGEMGLLRSAPRSATVVANEPVELLPINWKMIRRLQWLYPPTARKFMYNLLEIICGRVERLTTCLSDIKVLDDATGLCNREHFVHLLGREMHRAQRYEVPLSVGVLNIELEGTNPGIDLWQRENILRSISDALTAHLRPYDILGRCDPQNFSLLFPQTSAEAAWKVCNRLRVTLEETHLQVDGVKPKIVFGLAELKSGRDESPQALLNRAVQSLEQAKGLC